MKYQMLLTIKIVSTLALAVLVSCKNDTSSKDTRDSRELTGTEIANRQLMRQFLEYAWRSKLGSSYPIKEYSSAGDECSGRTEDDRYRFGITGLGDPDRDGNVEAFVWYRSEFLNGASGWSSCWGIVECSSGECRDEPWSDQIFESASVWIRTKYPNAISAFTHFATVSESGVSINVHATYGGEPHCCPRYSGTLTYVLDSGVPTLARFEIQRSPLDSTDSVIERNGDIHFIYARGRQSQLTFSGRDSNPSLSPVEDLVAYVRSTPDELVGWGGGDIEANELRLVTLDGSRDWLVLRGRPHEDMRYVLCGLSNPVFSINGDTLFFLSYAWAVSGAVHAVCLRDMTERFVTDGNSIEVLREGRHRGRLLVSKHKYYEGGGSYDTTWVVTSSGQEIETY